MIPNPTRCKALTTFSVHPALGSLVIALLTMVMAGFAAASTAHDEGVSGDLSTDPNNPTPVSLSLGSNVVTGTMQAPGDTRDYFTFTLGPSQLLSQVLLQSYVDLPGGGPGDTGFAAIIAGSTSLVPSGANIGSFLGTNHIIAAQVGTDILPGLAAAPFGGTGFTVPLGTGTYTFHVQQTGLELTGYSLDFIITPEPATLLLFSTGLVGLCLKRRR